MTQIKSEQQRKSYYTWRCLTVVDCSPCNSYMHFLWNYLEGYMAKIKWLWEANNTNYHWILLENLGEMTEINGQNNYS